MSAAATKETVTSVNSISAIFENLNYGPAPEADNVVKVKKIGFASKLSITIIFMVIICLTKEMPNLF